MSKACNLRTQQCTRSVVLQQNFCTVCLDALELTQILRSITEDCLHGRHAAGRAIGSKTALIAGFPLPVCASQICLSPCTDHRVNRPCHVQWKENLTSSRYPELMIRKLKQAAGTQTTPKLRFQLDSFCRPSSTGLADNFRYVVITA